LRLFIGLFAQMIIHNVTAEYNHCNTKQLTTGTFCGSLESAVWVSIKPVCITRNVKM